MKKLFTILTVITFNVQSQNFLNPSFETWGAAGCQANTTPDNWLNYSNGGMAADEANLTVCSHTIPSSVADGVNYARMIGGSLTSGEGFYQVISGLSINNVYQVSFQYAGSNLFGGSSDVQFHLFIDNIDVAQTPTFSPSKPNWSSFSKTFTASATSHSIGVRLYNAVAGSSEAGIDNFNLSNVTSIHENLSQNMIKNLYPNPTSSVLNVEMNGINKNTTIELYNTIGELVFNENLGDTTKSLDLQHLSSGIYFMKVQSDNQFVIKKIIKE